MKTIPCALIVLCAVCLQVEAQTIGITNYIPEYHYIPALCTNAGSTGLNTNFAWACIPVDQLSETTAAQAGATNAASDIRALMYGIDEDVYDAYSALAATNKPAKWTVSETPFIESGLNFRMTYGMNVYLSIDTHSVQSE